MLPLRVKPTPRETIPSLLSRLATTNGCGPAQFAHEMGFSLKRIVNQEPQALEMLFDLAGLRETERDDISSWTGMSAGNARTLFRGELFIARALRNATFRGCPACLREDAVGATNPLEAMVLRGHWQLREYECCLAHKRFLVPLWTANHPIERYDIAGQLTPIIEDVQAGVLDGQSLEPSHFDLWLDQRLESGSDQTWLAAHGLYPSATFCALLGAELLGINSKFAQGQTRAAPVGFAVAQHGPELINIALSEIMGATKETALEPRGGYGQLYAQLDEAHLNDPAFAPFCDIVRLHAFEHWPLGVEQKILGQAISRRRLHSLSSAAKEAGVTQKLLNALLIEAGAFEPHDQRSPRQKIFAAERYSELLEEIPYLVGKQAMQHAIGASATELQTLEADGVLVPRSKLSSVRSPWSTRDGQKLLDHLSSLATEIPAESEGWTTLQSARLRSGYSLDRLLSEVTAGTLRLGKRKDMTGYHSFVVNVSDLKNFLPIPEQKDRDDGLIPAATFGRSIGLRGKGTFLAFVEDGHTPSQLAGHAKTGQIRHYISPADIAAFHARFLTPTTLVTETGQHRNTALATLKRHVDARFTYDGIFFRRFW